MWRRRVRRRWRMRRRRRRRRLSGDTRGRGRRRGATHLPRALCAARNLPLLAAIWSAYAPALFENAQGVDRVFNETLRHQLFFVGRPKAPSLRPRVGRIAACGRPVGASAHRTCAVSGFSWPAPPAQTAVLAAEKACEDATPGAPSATAAHPTLRRTEAGWRTACGVLTD